MTNHVRLILVAAVIGGSIALAMPVAWDAITGYRYRTHKTAGMTALKSQDHEAAYAEFEAATRLLPDNPGGFLWLGWTRVQQQRFAEGEPHLLRGLELDPACHLCAFKLGTSRMRQHDFGAAADWYGKALAMKPDWPQGHYWHARALNASGRRMAAIEALTTAIQQDPTLSFRPTR